MKALISPNESVQTGFRVADVHQNGFEVAAPLFWVDCSDSVKADTYWYNPENQTIQEVPAPQPTVVFPVTVATKP